MKSVMTASQHFAQAPTANIERSTFDRSHGFKTTFDADYLVPIYLDECLPGDTFKANCQLFGRLATPINPIMDNMYMDVFFFYVPNRLVWDNWKKFMGEQTDPSDSTDYTIPSRNMGSAAATTPGSLADYFGLPIDCATGSNVDHSVLPLRAYHLIWQEWFRDQNLQSEVSLITDDSNGITTTAGYDLRKRNKKHDYFTSCLPWTQKINDGTSVSVPLSGEAWVKGIGVNTTDTNDGISASARDSYEGNVNTTTAT